MVGKLGMAVAALAVALVTAPPALGQTTADRGAISGRLIDDAGAPVARVDLDVSPVDAQQTWGDALSATDGSYTVRNLAPGRYRVRFRTTDDHVGGYYGGPSYLRAGPVTVRAGETTSGIDATLARGGSISGRVTDNAGNPLKGVWVSSDWGGFVGQDHAEPSAFTSSDGTYTLRGLLPGPHIVSFAGDGKTLLGEYYQDRPVGEGVQPVEITAGQTVAGVDAALDRPAQVSGRVVGGDGRPAANVQVLVDSWPGHGYPVAGRTGSDGTYTVTGVRPGAVAVSFRPLGTSTDAMQFFGGGRLSHEVTPVTTRDGETTPEVDAVLRPGRMITGRVTDAAGQPVDSVRVSASQTGGSFERLRDTYTDANGTYRLGGLEPGTYAVAFQPAFANLVAEYHGDSATIADAAPVTVSADAETTGIDASLAPGAVIRGSVTDEADGAPLRIAGVAAIPETPDELLDFHGIRSTGNDAEDYEIRGLRAGTYRVRFESPFDRDMEAEDHPKSIRLAAGETVVVDGALHDLDGVPPRPGRYAGRVTDSLGRPVAGARVTTISPFGMEWLSAKVTGADGRYTSSDLVAGRYHVRVAAPGRTSEFFPDSATLRASTAISITSGTTRAGVDVALDAPGTIPKDPPTPPEDPPTPPEDPPTPPEDPPTPPEDLQNDVRPRGDERADAGAPAPVGPAQLEPEQAFAPLDATARSVAPPRVSRGRAVLVGRSVALIRRGRVRVQVGCASAAPCRGRARLFRGRVVVAIGTFRLLPGQHATVSLRLTSVGRRLSARRSRLRVTVRLDGAIRPARLTLRRAG